MRFSIITVTYNAEKYLAETLASVKKQTFQDFEHILWDGGSTDLTIEIARAFPHVKIFQGKDEGISDAMNKGARVATGDFLLHLHADDLLLDENALLLVDTCLRQHPSVKWLYAKTKTIDSSGKVIAEPPFVPYSKKKLRKYNILSHPATFVERKLFTDCGGFNKELSYCMDYDLWLRLSNETEPFALPTFLSAFRQHADSLSTAMPLKVAYEAHVVRKMNLKCPLNRFRSYRTWKKREKRILNGTL